MRTKPTGKTVPFFVNLNVPCSNPTMLGLMEPYANGLLNAKGRKAAREHLEECPACAAFVFNLKEVATAANSPSTPSSRLRRVR